MRVSDFVPRRVLIITLWLAAGLTIIAGLEYLHGWQSRLTDRIAEVHLSALDLSRPESIANWFSCLMLLSAAVMSMFIHNVRRQNPDNKTKHYQIWIFAAFTWFLLATDLATGLHESLRQIMVHATGVQIYGNGSAWWILPYALVFGIIGPRLMIEMRSCWLSTTALALSLIGYLIAAAIELPLLNIADVEEVLTVKSIAVMYGHLMLLMAVVLKARHVILQAQEFLPQSGSTPATLPFEKPQIALVQSTTNDKSIRLDQPSGTPQPILQHAASTVPSNSNFSSSIKFESNATSLPVNRKLTKQERKALQERLIRERLERERRQQSAWK